MKRYTDAQKKKILAMIEAAPKGDLMKVIKKTKVSYATITKWKRGTGTVKAGKSSTVKKGLVTKLFKLRGDMQRNAARLDVLIHQL